EKRPNHQARSGMHPAQATRTRAAKQPQQKRLGLIVAGMAHRHNRGAQPRGGAAKKLVTRGVGGLLDRYAGLASEPSHLDALHVDVDGARGGQPPAELLVPVGLGAAKLMIEMRR